MLGPAPDERRIFYTAIWFRGHNNARYAELLPRLDRLDAYLLHVSEHRLLRPLQFHSLYRTAALRDPLLLRAASRRYRSMLATDVPQVPHFEGAILVDVDDPKIPRDVELLDRSGVKAYVVTDERAARRFEQAGLEKPWHVIPQGVSLRSVDPAEVAAARRRLGEDRLRVGYLAAWLLTAGDRGDQELYGVDHLLELWDELRMLIPRARLCLIGGASARLRRRCAGREDIVLTGRLARDRMLAHVAVLDLALYPRRKDRGIRSAKVAEYMGMGVPTVAYDQEVTSELRDAGAGILVETPRDFVTAVARLADDSDRRGRLAEAARRAGAARDWDLLAAQYATLLDRYL